MKKRTKISLVLSSAAAILLAGSVMAGGTYALFTSESKTNIAVTSGTVDVSASISEFSTYSGKANSLTGNPEVDETNIIATNVLGTFTNGGTAKINEETGDLILENVTPGDKVTFSIVITNKSDVKTKYRTILACKEDTGLFDGLKITTSVDESTTETCYGFSLVSPYSDLDGTSEENGTIVKTVKVSIELPTDAGNKYQTIDDDNPLGCTLSYIVEAVQGNAFTDDWDANTLYLYNAHDMFAYRKAANENAEILNNYSNGAKLISNVTLSSDWSSINDYLVKFDGGNKTLTFTGTQGLVNTLKAGSTIKNLNIYCTNLENAAVAYLAYCSETNLTTISNVTINGSVNYVAGMIGWLYTSGSGSSSSAEAIIENCVNNATVTNNGNRAVGLVGTIKALNVEFNGCVNNGDISVENTGEAHAAGIAGYVMKNTGDTPIYKFTNCKNYGKVSAKSTTDGRANVGGIISTAHQGQFTVEGCHNYGEISGEDAATKQQTTVGGIIGRANSKTTMNNCSNSGTINTTYSGTGGGNAYAGAAIGYGDNTTGTISSFTNSGSIGTSTITTKQLIVEGVVLIGGIHATGNWSYLTY